MNKKLGCIEGKIFTNDADITEMIECRFAHYCHLRKHTQIFVEDNSHHRHQDVTKEVKHGVKMISKEAQFSLCLILTY